MKKSLHYAVRLLKMLRLILLKVFLRGLSFHARKCDVSLATELRVQGNGRICVSNRIRTYGKTTISASGLVEIESVFLNRYDIIVCKSHIKIGKSCCMGPMVAIYDHDHLFDENGVRDEYSVGEIIIGDNVWIGANCVILKNTHIGNNCVIGAGCVVRGDIPDNSLVTMDRSLNVVPLRKK